MTTDENAELKSKLAELDESIARLKGELTDSAADAAEDTGDEGVDLTERMERDALLESLEGRRQTLLDKLGTGA